MRTKQSDLVNFFPCFPDVCDYELRGVVFDEDTGHKYNAEIVTTDDRGKLLMHVFHNPELRDVTTDITKKKAWVGFWAKHPSWKLCEHCYPNIYELFREKQSEDLLEFPKWEAVQGIDLRALDNQLYKLGWPFVSWLLEPHYYKNYVAFHELESVVDQLNKLVPHLYST